MAKRPTTRRAHAKKHKPVRRTRSTRSNVMAVGGIHLPKALLERYGIAADEFRALATFAQLEEPQRITSSRKLIDESIIEAKTAPDSRIALAVSTSQSLLDGYATLDTPHRAEIKRLIQQITAYLHDTTRKRAATGQDGASDGYLNGVTGE